MKKVLALVVAFALCFTALAGCFVTSAEGTAEVTFTNATASNGEALITASVDSGKTATYAAETVITVNGKFEFVELVGLTKYDPDSDEDFDYTVETSEDATVVKVLNTFENVAVLSYTIKLDAPVNATCKEVVVDDAINVVMEYAEFEEAVLCNAEGTTSVTLAANGDHAYDDGVVDPDATCTEEGVITYTCACGHSYTEAISPKGHTAGAAQEENRVEATLEAPGSYDMVVRCTVCNAVMSTETFEIPQLEPEEPAGPIIDETLVFAGAAPGYGDSSLQVNFRIRNNLLTKYSNMELVIIPDKYDMVTLNLVETPEEIVVPYANLSGTGTFRTYLYTDIQLYELGLTIRYMLRGTDAEGNAVESPVYETSIASYLKKLYNDSADAKFRTLLVDTLVVGDAAAKKMANQYADSDLAKAESIIDGFDISEATPAVDTYNTIDVHNATNSAWGTESGAHKVARSIVIEKVPSISYRIRGGSSIDLDKMSVTVSYTQVAGDGTETLYNRTFTSADTANIYKSGSFAMFKFDQIGLQDGDKDLSIVVNYDGAEAFNATYSIESYLGANMANESIGELCTAIIKLGISFRAYAAK